MQDEDVDHVEAAEGFDGRGTGIAGGGADDRGARAAPLQRAVHQPRHHLHGEILEGERRPVKQLEQPARRRNLAERRDGRVMEAAIGVVEHGFEVGEARIALEIGAHDAVGGFCIVEAGEGFDLGGRKTRPGFRHIEAAVAGKTREQRPFEGKGLRFAPCAHIPQSRPLKGFQALGRRDGSRRLEPRSHIDDIDDHKAKGEEKPGYRILQMVVGEIEPRLAAPRPASGDFGSSPPRERRAPRSWRHRRTWTWSWR